MDDYFYDDDETCDDCGIHASQIEVTDWIEYGKSIEIRANGPRATNQEWKHSKYELGKAQECGMKKYCIGCYADRYGQNGVRDAGIEDWLDVPVAPSDANEIIKERIERARERLEGRYLSHTTRFLDVFGEPSDDVQP